MIADLGILNISNEGDFNCNRWHLMILVPKYVLQLVLAMYTVRPTSRGMQSRYYCVHII